MSASMISTLAPVCARLIAVFVAVVVFPSDGRLDVINSDLGAWPAVESRIDVLSCLYASANAELESAYKSSSDFPRSSSSSVPPTRASFRLGSESIFGIAASAW